MTDREIARELERRGLQLEYLRALAVSVGVDLGRAGEPGALAALEAATAEERRRVALRVLERK